ncbi:MAG: hypothetical protein MUO39_04185 [Steroidobacteraceae bacterium]|nr:hypothetical protein [Steroidobacteraceae bacterium]
MFQADSRGILALVAFAMCWALAILLYRLGAPGSNARKLALLLVIEGVTMISAGYIDLMLSPAVQAHPMYATWFRWEFIVHTMGDCAMLALYPPFLASALSTPITRPLADPRIRWGLATIATVLFFATLTTQMKYGASALYVLLVMTFVFALVASIQAWHMATGAARTRARSFALAFGVRDLCWGFVYLAVVWGVWRGTYAEVPTDPYDPTYIIYMLGTLLAVPLIAYGILRTQLFDIDLRIRWTIKQSTIAAAAVAIIYAVSEGAERLLSSELGNFAGLIAAALVVFFMAPLQRFAERIASAAMPNTHDTPQYAAFRKLQVYEAAVEEALRGDGVSQKERAMLNRLRDTLEIPSADAEALERDLHARNQAACAASARHTG